MVDNIYSKEYFTVGEVSEISGLTKKTLRFYDEKGLLSPSARGENNYRYYTKTQVQDAIVISSLKMGGLTLSDICELYDGERPNTEKIYNALSAKTRDLRLQIEQLEKQLTQTANLSNQIISTMNERKVVGETSEDSQECKIISLPARKVLFTRYKSFNNANQVWWNRTAEIYRMCAEHNYVITGPLSAIYHDHYLNQFFFDYGDMEVFIPIADDSPSGKNVKCMDACVIASKTHQGPYSSLLPVYVSVVKDIEAMGYKITGPAMEEYLIDFMHCAEESDYITRVSFPVEKATDAEDGEEG